MPAAGRSVSLDATLPCAASPPAGALPMLMSAARSCLLVVDIQARLAPSMAAPHQVIDNTGILIKALRSDQGLLADLRAGRW